MFCYNLISTFKEQPFPNDSLNCTAASEIKLG